MKAYIVEKADLEQNLRILQRKAGKALIWGVLKGNGYGLGTVPLARFLAAHGIDHFAVTELQEARGLREAGFSENPILMLRGVSEMEELDALLDLNVILTIGSWADAMAMEAAAERRATVAEAHLKIDTGMGRYGFLPEEMEQAISLYERLSHVAISGVYTHFHTAGNRKRTTAQFSLFLQAVDRIRAAGYETGMVHCCNSIAFWKYPEMHCDAVRLGSTLLGRVRTGGRAGLHRIGWAEATVEELRTLPKGHNVGYGGDCKLKRETRVAIVGVGYFHGFSVERGYDVYRFQDCLRGIGRYVKYLLQRKALWVQIGGRSCQVLGHVGMVNLAVDVSAVSCQLGDPVILQINPLDLKGMEVVYR